MAVREFNGSTDKIITAMGGTPPTGDSMTVLFVCRILAVEEQWLIRVWDPVVPGSPWGANPFFDGLIYFKGKTLPYAPADNWVILGFSKVSGTGIVTSHYYNFDTDTWTHTDLGAAGNATGTSPDQVIIGNDESGGRALNGRLAVIGAWAGTLSQVQIESLTAALTDWQALNPAALWAFNQESTSDPVLDITGNGADQTAITGTAVVTTDDPPGFSFAPSTARTQDDTLSLTDDGSQVRLNADELLTDTLTLTDTGNLVSRAAFGVDTLGLSDVVSVLLNGQGQQFTRTPSDTLTLTDTGELVSKAAFGVDLLGLSDAVSAPGPVNTYTRTPGSTLSLSDTVTPHLVPGGLLIAGPGRIRDTTPR